MPKSGVSLGAVIIFHVKKYTVLISQLICMSCTHTHRYEYNLEKRWSPHASEQRVYMATFSDSSAR